MEENNLDKYFREKLATHSEEPSPAVWENIAAETGKAGFVWNRKLLLLLLLLLTVGGAVVVGYNIIEMDSRVSDLEEQLKIEIKSDEGVILSDTDEAREEEVIANDKEETSEGGISVDVREADIAVKDVESVSETDTDTQVKRPFDPNSNGDKLSSKNEETDNLSASEDKLKIQSSIPVESSLLLKASYSPPSYVKGKKPTDANMDLNSRQNQRTESVYSPTLAESEDLVMPVDFSLMATKTLNLFEASTPSLVSDKREVEYYSKSPSWDLFIYGMVNYTHRRVIATAEGSEAIPNQLDKVENGLVRPGGGLQISRELGSSIRLSLGVEFNQWVQEASNEIEVPADDLNIFVNAGQPVFNFGGEITNSIGSQIYVSNTPESPLPDDGLVFSDASSLIMQIESRQTINYLTLPLTLDYVIDSYPWSFFAGGGFSVNQIIGSNTEYTVNPEIEGFEIDEAESVDGTYLAFHVGFGVDYLLSERLSLRINPSYRGWMSPIFENDDYRTLPFGVAVRGGLVYRLNP